MRKGIMSLEDLDESVDLEVADGELDLANAEGETEASELASDSDQIDETESIADSVDSLTDQVEARVGDGTGISEDTAAALEVAVEHFKLRLGYSKKIVPAMEGFKDATSRLDKTKVTLENLKELQAGLNKSLAVAQEGLGERFVNAIKRAFTNDDKIRSSMNKVKTKAAIEPKDFKDPAWGRVFALGGKHELTGADVLKHLKEIKKFRGTLIPMIKELNEIIRKATNEVDKSRFIAKDEAVEELNKLTEEGVKIKERYDSEFAVNFNKEASVNIKSATDSEIKQIADTVIDLVNDSEFTKVVADLNEVVGTANVKLWTNQNTRIMAVMAADIKAFHRLLEGSVTKMYRLVAYTTHIDWKASYSAYKYVEASAVK